MTSREDVTAAPGRAIVTVRRRAVLAVAVAALAIAGVACNGDDDAANVDEQPVLKVETNSAEPVCLKVADSLPAEVETLPIIDCAEPHTHEIYATIRSAEEVFPGVDALSDVAEVKCLEAFEPFVGTSPFDSALSYSWLVPTLESWNSEDDREILCVLMNREQADLVGTMRAAQR